ncbi:MAG TPA: hypothetical protein VLE89_01180 [Chlamydiales bacterium]|nr:hypothetical protein [Chlamydiales bacterium]
MAAEVSPKDMIRNLGQQQLQTGAYALISRDVIGRLRWKENKTTFTMNSDFLSACILIGKGVFKDQVGEPLTLQKSVGKVAVVFEEVRLGPWVERYLSDNTRILVSKDLVGKDLDWGLFSTCVFVAKTVFDPKNQNIKCSVRIDDGKEPEPLKFEDLSAAVSSVEIFIDANKKLEEINLYSITKDA